MSEHSKLLNIKCRGLKTQSLVDQLSSASFSPAIKHVLDLILATPHFVIEVGYPIGAIDDDRTPLDGREPSDGFKRVFAAALNADIEALIGEHERLAFHAGKREWEKNYGQQTALLNQVERELIEYRERIVGR